MRITICNDNGEVFAIHDVTHEECQEEWIMARMGCIDFSTQKFYELACDISTAICNQLDEDAEK